MKRSKCLGVFVEEERRRDRVRVKRTGDGGDLLCRERLRACIEVGSERSRVASRVEVHRKDTKARLNCAKANLEDVPSVEEALEAQDSR